MKKVFTAIALILTLCISSNARTLTIKKLNLSNPEPSELPAIFANAKVSYQEIGFANWPERFPYKPETSFALAYTENAFLIHFKVKGEKGVLATVKEDMGPVWGDACVEFFFTLGNDSLYYNLECNCLGNLLMQFGDGRNERINSTKENLLKIKRWASLDPDKTISDSEEVDWELALVIPCSSFFQHDIKAIDLKKIRANFYKCGGSGDNKHYISWNPVKTEKPNFHKPEFFGTVKLKQDR